MLMFLHLVGRGGPLLVPLFVLHFISSFSSPMLHYANYKVSLPLSTAAVLDVFRFTASLIVFVSGLSKCYLLIYWPYPKLSAFDQTHRQICTNENLEAPNHKPMDCKREQQ